MPPAPAAAAAGYRPRPAQNQLKEIVEENLEALLRHGDERFRDTYGPLHRRVRTVLEDFLRCGDPHFGKPLPPFEPLEAAPLSVSIAPPSPPAPTTTAPTLLPPGDEEGELARRRNWARLIARTWLCDPELCSSCGQRLRVVAAISSPA